MIIGRLVYTTVTTVKPLSNAVNIQCASFDSLTMITPDTLIYRTVGYVCEVQIFAKFANKGLTRKNFCWKRVLYF